MYKIAIAGASTLLGRELKDAVAESALATANVVLLDSDQAHGKLDHHAGVVRACRLHLLLWLRGNDQKALA